MRKLLFFVSVFAGLILLGFGVRAQSGIITTVAGNGDTTFSGDGGPATAAGIGKAVIVTVDRCGNIYIEDLNHNRIRKVDVSGIISTVAGNGVGGFSGDDGVATDAELWQPYGIAIDNTGNLYIADAENNRVRKVSPFGVITTIAGNGINGFTGDGGAATAAELATPMGIAVDGTGNLYIGDGGDFRVRKVSPSGIITTIIGNGLAGYSGDGASATNAQIGIPYGVAVDGHGNVYVADGGNNRIRKVNTFGIITTIAGNGTASFSGDGGAATDAGLNSPNGIAVDGSGNVYIADGSNERIRMVNTFGIITTFAGNSSFGFLGDGGEATAASLWSPSSIAKDIIGNTYISDLGNVRIRKILNIPVFISDSFSVYIDNYCDGLQFQLITKSYSSGQHFTTLFGNGTRLDTSVSPYYTFGIANFYQPYISSGIYTIKHVLYDGSLPVDSISYSYNVSLCQNFSLGLYNDALGTCSYNDSADIIIPLPVLVEVDSNTVPIDTVSVSGGLNYVPSGISGDIYTFRIISTPNGMAPSCPSSGIISDTLFERSNPSKYFGFQCYPTTDFDLGLAAVAQAGRHMQSFLIDASNAYCTNENASVSLTFSPQYIYRSAFPVPTSVSGNIAIWNLGNISTINSNQTINVTLSVPDPGAPSTWLTPGDTVQTYCRITPVIGDTDTLNNVIIRVDTVKSSWDPNEMSVSPSGCIHSDTATMLTYTVMFENTGNDTAHNIYVMDTLSDNLDPKSLRIVSASNTMNISKWYDSIHHNIYKFEFPHINLPDSSHHNQCDGMFIYTIKTKAGLPTGTTIFNHAGIFFDDNAVVMTDTTENVMNCPLSVSRSPLPVLSPSLYPNPATNELTIKTPGNNYSSFIITNLMGQQMMQQSIEGADTKLNIATLPAGVYFVTFIGETGEVVKKFVKM